MLSIVVPVYNVAPYLDRCFESINAQTLEDYEVIVVNDGSTDNSLEICKKFADGNPKYHLYSKENGGLMSAWMYAVEKANGDYFGFVDSDDYIHPTMFERLYVTAKEKDCDIVMCDRIDVCNGVEIPGKTNCIEPGFYSGDDMDKIYRNILPKFSSNHITNARWNKVFRRELFLENTKYCRDLSKICEDRFITPPCVFSAKSFCYISEPLYYYVLREGSNHSMASERLQNAMELLYEKHKEMISDKGLEDKYGDLVERANLNWLRLMMQRNFMGNGSFGLKMKLAKRMLANESYHMCIKKYRADLTGKAGLCMKIFFATRCRTFFVLACKFCSY